MNEPNDELYRLSQDLIRESWGNEQEFKLENPEARDSSLDYYVERALAERDSQERIR